jgi:hypothetical protein
METQTEQTKMIAELNDAFRRGGFGVTVTQGIRAIEDLPGLMRAVRAFETFTEDNDPYGEHDFGSIVWHDETVLWKIDYYDRALKGGENPLSRHCRRVLTVMLAEEY